MIDPYSRKLFTVFLRSRGALKNEPRANAVETPCDVTGLIKAAQLVLLITGYKTFATMLTISDSPADMTTNAVLMTITGFFIGGVANLVSAAVSADLGESAILTLRERLRTHKVFTKDQCFYLNYHKFSIKSYVLDVY